MKQKRYTDEQIAFALRQAESGAAVAEICGKLGVSEPTSIAGESSSLGWERWRSGG
jgi:transposase-like protein